MKRCASPHYFVHLATIMLLLTIAGCFRRREVSSKKQTQKLAAQKPAAQKGTSALSNFIVPHEGITPPPDAPVEKKSPIESRDNALQNPSLPQQEGQSPVAEQQEEQLADIEIEADEEHPKSLEDQLVRVDFEQEDLNSIISYFATLQGHNIIFPTGADAITQKITFKLPHPVKLRDINKYVDTFLELSGYSRVPHGSFYRIVKNDPNIVREALPLYITSTADDIPNTDERIRVVCYFRNLRVPEGTNTNEPLTLILNDMLSTSAKVSYDSRTNAVIIADKANNIRSALNMLLELDAIGTKDILRTINLFNVSADAVTQLLNSVIGAAAGEDAHAQGDAGKYFSPHMRVVADNRTNSLIVMGREAALERIEDFVKTHLDVPSDSGQSIIHFYELQYLDAEKFATVLQNIVSEGPTSGQATKTSTPGAYHFFDGVRVVPEKVFEEKAAERLLASAATTTSAITTALKGTVYRGGNRLIVTATNRDWKRIEHLIRELDKPRLQIIVQVMIIDFTANTDKIIGAQTRNPAWMQLPPGLNFQTAHLVAPPILNGTLQPGQTPLYLNPTTVAADLLRIITAGSTLTPNGQSAAGLLSSGTNIGSSIISFTDNNPKSYGVWSFLQWLNQFGYTNVLSHPHVVTANNTRGEAEASDIRLLVGPAQTGEGGAIAQKQIDVKASLKVSVVPRASSTDRLNLQISITIEQFASPTDSTNRSTRQLHTDVNLNTGQTLLLGGLMTYTNADTINETPILGKIPILKWLFSSFERGEIKSNLLVLVTPTIVEPKIRTGLEQFTRDRIHYMREQLGQDEVFSQIQDPITYLFFDNHQDISTDKRLLDEFVAESKGDFVFPNHQLEHEGLSDHHCLPCAPADKIPYEPPVVSRTEETRVKEEKNVEKPFKSAQERIGSTELKRQLAFEENPLASH
jgi:general secretion pathway protein D